VSDDAGLERPQLVWNMVAGIFCIHVPRRRPAGNAIIEAGLDDDLDGFFVGASGPPQNPMPAQNEKEPESALPAEDTWTDIGGVDDQRTEPARGGAPPIPSRPVPRRTQAASKVDDLPAVGTVSRPAKLFKSIAPYVLTVNATKIPLLVQGSHQPSLEYIASYLKKWARVDQNNAAKVRASHPLGRSARIVIDIFPEASFAQSNDGRICLFLGCYRHRYGRAQLFQRRPRAA
jgi:hypothetical protein